MLLNGAVKSSMRPFRPSRSPAVLPQGGGRDIARLAALAALPLGLGVAFHALGPPTAGLGVVGGEARFFPGTWACSPASTECPLASCRASSPTVRVPGP